MAKAEINLNVAFDVLGVALAYLRLAMQGPAIGLSSDFYGHLPRLIQAHLPTLRKHTPQPRQLSPILSPVGPALLEIFRQTFGPDSSGDSWDVAVSTLDHFVAVARRGDGPGADEVLYGRAGLLWGMLNLRKALEKGDLNETKRTEIERIVNEQAIADVVSRIVETGKAGAQAFAKQYGEDAFPLIWDWQGTYYLGA